MKQTFPGDHRQFDEDSYVGREGRFFRPVDAAYDGTTTTITYVPVPLEEMPQRYGHLVDSAVDRLSIAELFGATS